MRFFVFILSIFIFASCNQPTQEEKQEVRQSEQSIPQKHADVLKITGKAAKKLDDWQEYRSLNEFLVQYKSISPNEALNNSRELNGLVESMKDSIKPEFLEVASFNARVNLLHNETLRLFDMSFISSIKSQEVNDQVSKVLEAFSAVNSKVNTLIQQEDLDRQIDDPKFNRLFSRDSSSDEDVMDGLEIFQKIPVKKNETKREQKMRLMKEERLKKRERKLREIKKNRKKNKKKKKTEKLKTNAKIKN